MDWRKFVKNLRPKPTSEDAPEEAPQHAILKRDDDFKHRFKLWRGNDTHKNILDWIWAEYAYSKHHLSDKQSPEIDFLKTRSAHGFFIHFKDMDSELDEVRFLMDFFKEEALTLGYRAYLSDVKKVRKPNWMLTTERHYLKPPPNFSPNKKSNQLFGNITIELSHRDNTAIHLKFFASPYHKDHRFTEALPFETLLEEILTI